MDRKNLEKNIKKVTLELVEKKSWYHVLCFIEKNFLYAITSVSLST